MHKKSARSKYQNYLKQLLGSKNIILNLLKILVKVPTLLVANHTFMRHGISLGNLSRIDVNEQLLV